MNADLQRAQQLYQSGDLPGAEAALLAIVRVDPSNIQALELLSVICTRTRRLEEAIQYTGQLVKLAPATIAYADRLAALLENAGKFEEAIVCSQELVNQHPSNANIRYNYAALLKRAGRLDAALEQYSKALQMGISQPEDVLTNISVVLSDLHRHHEAEKALRRALELAPNYIPALYNLGVVMEELGDWDSARALFERILEIDPAHTESLTHLANGRRFDDPRDPIIVKMQNAITTNLGNDIHARTAMHFSLGKVLDDTGQYPLAFEQFFQGNEQCREIIGAYDAAAQEAQLAAYKNMHHSGFLGSIEPVSEKPLFFICGMFRSGSTLLEQMLASHAQVTAGGELSYFNQALPTDATQPMEVHQLRDIGEGYLDYLKNNFPNAAHVTDKRPDNWQYLGIIRALFPNAKFINTGRHPLDNCLSLFFHQFAGSMSYHTRLLDIGHYYAQYVEFMNFWRDVAPENIYELNYQSLTAAPRETLEPMLHFLGLNWDDNCLQYYKADNRVRTASVWQVRQPLYQKAKGRWQNYEEALEPLKQYLTRQGIDV
ncbi:MAG: sulfotransferase [Halioglobus sp.]